MVNSGTLTNTTFNVGQGTQVILAGGTYEGTTTFNVAQAATVDLTGGQQPTYGGTMTGSGAGTVLFASGNIKTAVGGLTFNFPGKLFQWSGGSFLAALGDVTNQGTMNLSGSGAKGFYEDATLDNFGTIIQTGSGNFGLHSDDISPTTFKNEAGATYRIESDSGIDNPFGGQVAVINAGTIIKAAGVGTSTLFINGPLANTGTIEADSGTLYLNPNSFAQLSAGTLTDGAWKALGGATLKFPAATSITSNAANVSLSGAGANVTALSTLASNSGSLSITDGASFSSTGDLTNSGQLTLGSGGALTVGGNFTQTAAGAFDESIGGSPQSGLFGQLAVNNVANLDGAFHLSLEGGFVPGKNTVFPVMTFASVSGNFASVTGLSPFFTEQLNPASLELVNGSATPVALMLTQATAPTAATVGQQITVNWQTTNTGGNDANGNWQDSVYLSTTPSITSSSILLGNAVHQGGLTAGASYNASLTAALPFLPPGNYYVLVRGDSLNQLAIANRADEILAATSGPLAVAVPALTLDAPTADAFSAANQDRYYQVTVPAGGSLSVALTSNAASGALALYVSQGVAPTSYNYQYAALVANQPNQALAVPNSGGGTYYILVHSIAGAAATDSYSLLAAQISDLSVSAISSYSGGNGGEVTVEIDGANFTPQAAASLTLGATTINASSIEFVSGSRIFATFDLAGAFVGDYALHVQQGAQSATAAAPFHVVAASQNDGLLQLSLSMPDLIRAGRTAPIVITYTNTTDNDLVAGLLEITSTNPNILFSTPDDPNHFVSHAQLLAVAPSGPAGVLRPGQSGQLTLTLLTQGAGGDQIPVTVRQVQPGKTIDWASRQADLRPEGVSTDAWNVIYGNLTATLGSTTDSYKAALAQAATYLSDLGETQIEVSNVSRLWAFLLAQADAALPSATLASATDASLPAPGALPLQVSRTFGSSISDRATPGIFGLGWSTPWQATASAGGDGNVTIDLAGSQRYFVALNNGVYLPVAGEHGALTASAGAYTYTDASGVQYVFLASGKLNYEQDANGNRITLGYNGGGQLVTLTWSNPGQPSQPSEQLTLSYNAQGLVSQVDDGAGGVWTYAYDAAGRLLSATAPGSLTTSYGYDTGVNGKTANALLSITNPDGSQRNFTYDSATGRLTGVSANGGAEAIAYAYLGQGEVSITDIANNQTLIWYNDLGLAARVQDASGGISNSSFDTNGNLVSYVNAAGGSYQYQYDQQGNLTQIIDPLGQSVTMTYGPLNQLASLTDGAGARLRTRTVRQATCSASPTLTGPERRSATIRWATSAKPRCKTATRSTINTTPRGWSARSRSPTRRARLSSTTPMAIC